MRKRKRAYTFGRGFGTGYATVLMLFIVITLTVFASLSFSAAGIGSGKSDRSRELTAAYYEAESRAYETLMKIDEAAIETYADGIFGLFAEKLAPFDGVSVSENTGNFTVSWSERISEHVSLVCEAEFYAKPELHENKRFTVTKWGTVSSAS